MPAGTQAAVAFALLIAPGFLMVRGYGHRRYRTTPERDVYAVAEAVAASAIWLAIAWAILLLMGDPVQTWGLVPWDPAVLAHHREQAVGLALAVIVLPYPIGAGFAALIDHLESTSDLFLRIGQKLGLLRNPTAWDRAWLSFDRLGPGEVHVRLKDGSMIRGSWGEGGQADLSPSSDHHLLLPAAYLEEAGLTGQKVEDTGAAPKEVVIRAEGPSGVFIQGDEIAAVFFIRR
jgi:hypothetical protein